MHEHHDHHDHHDHAPASPAETLALLTYMLGHNRHHAEELHELAHGASETAAALIHEAVDDLMRSNEKLAQALEAMKRDASKEEA